MSGRPPKYPNLAMTAAVLWLALGAAGILWVGIELVRQSYYREEGLIGPLAGSAALLVVGILILTGVLGRTTLSGVASLVFGAVLLLMFLVEGL